MRLDLTCLAPTVSHSSLLSAFNSALQGDHLGVWHDLQPIHPANSFFLRHVDFATSWVGSLVEKFHWPITSNREWSYHIHLKRIKQRHLQLADVYDMAPQGG